MFKEFFEVLVPAHSQHFSCACQQGDKEKICSFGLFLQLKTTNSKILARILGCARGVRAKKIFENFRPFLEDL